MMKTLTWRRDGKALVVFSRRDGSKVRFSLGAYPKATWPELVDIKLTDWCDMGCTFCYQASTLQGKHAPWEHILFIAEELAGKKVFEVALGGGEATGHPHFLKTLEAFASRGVVPNFTTKKPALVRRHWRDFQGLIGGFAYSAETAGQVYSSAKLLESCGALEKMNYHYVMGLGGREHFRSYLQAVQEVGARVTLLGYKTVGRGKEVKPEAYHWWVEEVSKLVGEGRCPDLSIDTPLAGEYQDVLPVDRRLYHTEEGKFSLYIDAVALTMGASSFEAKETLVPFDSEWVARYGAL